MTSPGSPNARVLPGTDTDQPHQGFTMGLLNHAAVPGGITTTYAHHVMQLHLDCSTDTCPIRRQARYKLIEAGQMVPDSHRDNAHAMGY